MKVKHSTTLQEVIASLDRVYPLASSDRAALEALPFETTEHPSHFYLVREGNRPSACCMLLEGYACRHKTTSSGERQIVSFHIPGDMLDLQHLELHRADHNVQTITPATIAWVPKAELQRVIDEHPAVRTAVWRSALIDASIFREWVLNVGRREAVSRVAHMLCEFVARREAAGLGSPDRFRLPMTQEDIADATGLTPVHVNRMLQTLGARGVMTRDKREVRIVDWEGMRRIADFNPAYLHLAGR
ncbi:Crp/Fnr family transcriptional regulator [Sphingomonas sp. MMS24-J45]|uniref:Crp/Fnr family transcriptional regulator n=1 Tax=Sphingomonas sp. MMS24-J45 TaxID=3238806 RepID=UPI00384E2EA6